MPWLEIKWKEKDQTVQAFSIVLTVTTGPDIERFIYAGKKNGSYCLCTLTTPSKSRKGREKASSKRYNYTTVPKG